jgi:hypothetical protein
MNQDENFQYWLNIQKHYQQLQLQQLTARYQVGLIIIPTIVGFWGFIGLIVISQYFIDHPLFIDIVASGGIIITFFLIWMWRKRVHDISSEEITYNSKHAKIEAELFLRKSPEEDIENLIENDFSSDYPVSPYIAYTKSAMKKKLSKDFYEHLHSEKKLYCFF